MQGVSKSLLFFTGNSTKTRAQLSEEIFSRNVERLRLVEEYSVLEAVEGERSSISKFDDDSLDGRMILRGLLVLDDPAQLPPHKRLLLAQWRYLEEELKCLLEMTSTNHTSNSILLYHKSSEFFEIQRSSSVQTPINSAGIEDTAMEEGELPESEDNSDHKPKIFDSTNLALDNNVRPVDAGDMSIVADIAECSTGPVTTLGQQLRPIQLTAPVSKEETAWEYFRKLQRMTEEDRDKELRQVQIRYQKKYFNQKLIAVMPVFDPTADVGILITYGMLIPPKAMKISSNFMNLIETGRSFRGVPPKLPNRTNKEPIRGVPIPAISGSIVSKAEVAAVKRRYVQLHNGDKMAEVMPIFDPSTDLGKLILWGEYIPPQNMQISALHLEQIRETRAARGLDPTLPNHSRMVSVNISTTTSDKLHRAGSDFASQLEHYQSANQYTNAINDIECTVLQLQSPTGSNELAVVEQQRARLQRLLRRVRTLEESIPVEQRVQIPELWITLGNETSAAVASSSNSAIPMDVTRKKRKDRAQVGSTENPTPSKRPALSYEVPTELGNRTSMVEVNNPSNDTYLTTGKSNIANNGVLVDTCDSTDSTIKDVVDSKVKGSAGIVDETLRDAHDFPGKSALQQQLKGTSVSPTKDCLSESEDVPLGVAKSHAHENEMNFTTDSSGDNSAVLSGGGERENVQRELERMQELYNLWISD